MISRQPKNEWERRRGGNEPRTPSPTTTGTEDFPPGPAAAAGALDPSPRTIESDPRPGTTFSPCFVTREGAEGAFDPSPTMVVASPGRGGRVRPPDPTTVAEGPSGAAPRNKSEAVLVISLRRSLVDDGDERTNLEDSKRSFRRASS